MKNLFFFATLSIMLSSCITPKEHKPIQIFAENAILKEVDEKPRFPGCEDMQGTNKEKLFCAESKLLKFIQKYITYPARAREIGTQGRCFVTFVVEKNGTITGIKLLRSIGGGCDEESLRVVYLMTEQDIIWIPAKYNGKIVRYQFNLPIHFRL